MAEKTNGSGFPDTEAFKLKIAAVADDALKCCKDYSKKLAESLVGGSESLTPHVFVTSMHPDGSIGVSAFMMGVGFNEDNEKLAAMQFIARNLAAPAFNGMPLALSLVSEAWMAMLKEGQPYVQPRDDPSRQEVVMIQCSRIDRTDGVFASRNVVRQDGELRFDGEWSEFANGDPRLIRNVWRFYCMLKTGQDVELVEDVPNMHAVNLKKLLGENEAKDAATDAVAGQADTE